MSSDSSPLASPPMQEVGTATDPCSMRNELKAVPEQVTNSAPSLPTRTSSSTAIPHRIELESTLISKASPSDADLRASPTSPRPRCVR
eukprot:1383798-Amphidinium_carterae.1